MSDTTRLKESLSALMDGAAEELELHRTLKAVSQNFELRDSWHRYQLARSAMHRELPTVRVDLSGAISAAIEQEESFHRSGRLGRVMKPLARAAIAASVTVVAVLGFQQYNQQNTVKEAPQLAADSSRDEASPAPHMPRGFEVPQLATRTVSSNGRSVVRQPQRQVVLMGTTTLDPAAREKIQSYFNELMIRHTEWSALGTNQGMMPFARLPQEQEDE